MRILLATLVLNEMEWLPKLYAQHHDWPDLVSWVFVESADGVYARTNPDMVSKEGLSVDGTSKYLRELAASDPRVRYIPYGFSEHSDPAQGKIDSRNQYLIHADVVEPTFVVILDADEFYTITHQHQMNEHMERCQEGYTGFCFRQREIWHPPSIADKPLFQYEVVGGLWKMHHCHGWRYVPGMRYKRTHVWPEDQHGRVFNERMARYDNLPGTPEYIHMAQASSLWSRKAKTDYYAARGEGVTDHRQYMMDCRRAFETWQPNDPLPHGAQVIQYNGPVPEVFLQDHATKN